MTEALQIAETANRSRELHHDDPSSLTPLTKANLLLRKNSWEQAAIAYLAVLEGQPSLRPIITGNVTYLLKKAPQGCIPATVVDKLASILSSTCASGIESTFPRDFSTTSNFSSSEVESSPLTQALMAGLGVEQIYVVNLGRRSDRYVRALREISYHSLHIKRIEGIDALTSVDAQRALDRFRARPIEERRNSSAHINDVVMRRYKKELSAGVFGYILSQAKVLNDAILNGYKRILVLDDDVFFCSDAVSRLIEICTFLPSDLKILALGASEYSDRNLEKFRNSYVYGRLDLYQPIPGETCGSFAMVYDRSVYEELIGAIDEADGTFDNVILGSIYLNNPGKCVVVDPAICIPDVGDSDIRLKRVQASHSVQMNWEIKRYGDYTKPLNLTVLISSFDSLRYIESMAHELGSKIFLNVFYRSADGLRPVITGHRFTPLDSEAMRIAVRSPIYLRHLIDDLRIPFSDIVLLWPVGRLLSEDTALSAFVRAMQAMNSKGIRDGVFDGIYYCINAGVSTVPGRHSIIIPSYRSVESVLPTVRSALLQDTKDFEVVVVNDNPEDKQFSLQLRTAAAILEKEFDISGLSGHLIVIDHQQNRNGAAARNTGLAYSSGEFISFLDDDDYYEPNRLSAIMGGFIGTEESVGASYCGYTGNWNGEQNIERFPEGNLGDYVLALQYSKHYLCTNTITFLRTAMQRLNGFNEGYIRHQDLELMVRFFEHFEVTAVKEFLVKNRPNNVPETFVADIDSLCRLKHFFFSDMKRKIIAKGSKLIEDTIEAHTYDIIKRDKNLSSNTVNIIKTFLSSALK